MVQITRTFTLDEITFLVGLLSRHRRDYIGPPTKENQMAWDSVQALIDKLLTAPSKV